MSKGKIITVNRKAYFDYVILEEYEAGIVLVGAEVKAIRENKADLKDSYITIDKEIPYIINMHIGMYSHSMKVEDYNPRRKRKVLLTKKELKKITGKIKAKGLTVIPINIHFNNRGYAKLKIALVKGKKMYDKREAIKKKDFEKEMKKEKF